MDALVRSAVLLSHLHELPSGLLDDLMAGARAVVGAELLRISPSAAQRLAARDVRVARAFPRAWARMGW